MYEAYPLQWPAGYKRTPSGVRISSQFKQTMSEAQRFLKKQMEMMKASDLVISTNIPTRKSDGGFYADMINKKIDDPGVAIYFKHKKMDRSMCCDQYVRVWENIYALAKGLEALRGIERWGISEFLDRAFTGFPALPEMIIINQKSIWKILGLDEMPADHQQVRFAYKRKAMELHPDKTGSSEKFIELQHAYKQALSQFNERP